MNRLFLTFFTALLIGLGSFLVTNVVSAEEEVLQPLEKIHGLLAAPSPVAETTAPSAPEHVHTFKEKKALQERVEAILSGEEHRLPEVVKEGAER